MDKWILWGLLEAATIMTVASLWLIWRTFVLRKKQQQEKENADASASSSSQTIAEEPEGPADEFKGFAKKLEEQANIAADHLKSLRGTDDLQSVTQYKVWGTLAKAERAIILNDSTGNPEPILNRFMASILSTLESLKNSSINKLTLTNNIQELNSEFEQASEILYTKEELIRNQKALHKELQDNIDRAGRKVTKMGVKSTELQRLTLELKKLQDQVKQLESHNDHTNEYILPQQDRKDSSPEQYSNGHLKQLERLSGRQQTIIDHLQAELKNTSEDTSDAELSRKAALTRMERLAQESQSLITQLQTELDSANLSIDSLKSEVNFKEQQIKELDEKLKAAKGGVAGGYQVLNDSKQTALEEILGGIESWSADNANSAQEFSDQTKEISNLEQMLRESETCVQLLVQELETAEMDNNKLRKEVEQRAKSQRTEDISKLDPNSPIAKLAKLRTQNQTLVEQIHDIKENLLEEVAGTGEKALRNEYNKKSLELDRLQLAYSDLERKYLGTLR